MSLGSLGVWRDCVGLENSERRVRKATVYDAVVTGDWLNNKVLFLSSSVANLTALDISISMIISNTAESTSYISS